MNPVWIAFFSGIFIGANIGIVVAALLVMARHPCDHYLPDIGDVHENADPDIGRHKDHG